MICANCGEQRDADVLACAHCGSTNVVEPASVVKSPLSDVTLCIILAIAGVMIGLILGFLLGLITSLSLYGKSYGETISFAIDIVVIGGIAFGAFRAFAKRALPVGWLLIGIALGGIGPAAVCSTMVGGTH